VVIGIDVGADRLHCVGLDERCSLVGRRVIAADDLAPLTSWAATAEVVAVDAPAQLSTAPHGTEESLSPKFRSARCAEIALGLDHGIWVPWTSPTGPPVPGWIATGLAVFDALRATIPGELIEVFPYGGFRVLTRPKRLAKKTSVAGLRQRIEALRAAGLRATDDLALWSHDSIDAALAAIVALQHRNGSAVPATCGHDDSAIWLPRGA
jgi:predicted nuclease with RNAse H fold